jgi:Protein of unknown function (DUF664)
VTDEFSKEYLLGELRSIRTVMLSKLDGLSEYDVRRPLTKSGTNLLGLIKHLAAWEACYFGDVFDRPFPGQWRKWDDPEGYASDMWVEASELRDEIVGRYLQAWEYSDATITSLEIDTHGYVPWWPRPNVILFNVMVHVLTETSRHAGHADILREHIDGSTGDAAQNLAHRERFSEVWEIHCAKVEAAAERAGQSQL